MKPSGLYIHVPFCQSRCIYCDFFSTTRPATDRALYVEALKAEMDARASEAETEVNTLYIGGGTPSLLTPDQLADVLHHAAEVFPLSPTCEKTIEVNPDDVSRPFVRSLRAAGINRVSMGVQSFSDQTLRFLRRRHTARQATEAVETLASEGITNISIDLIHSIPGEPLPQWEANVRQAFALPIKHLSAYELTYEPATPLYRLKAEGRLKEVDEEICLQQADFLMDAAAAAGFDHYEISNFARPGFGSRHNQKYWHGNPYIGLGPGAHSFDGRTLRRQNLPDLSAYLARPYRFPHSIEQLTQEERYEETIFTALRTKEGIDLTELEKEFGQQLAERTRRLARPHIARGLLTTTDGPTLRLTRPGLHVSNMVMSSFMF